MNWETHPPYGTERSRVKFAWLPVDLDNRRTVWLERYVEVSRYCEPSWGAVGAGWDVVARRAASHLSRNCTARQ